MNNTMKRRHYAAPTAELICFAPAASIATNDWTWSGGKGSNTKWNQNSWGSPITNLFENASATGIAQWADSDELDGQ